jgi:hypothetical protein
MGAQERGGTLTAQPEVIRKKFSELLAWERRKRREQSFISLSFYALVAALLTVPLSPWLPAAIGRWWMPLLFFLIATPVIFFRRRWRLQDSARAVTRMDKALRLQERALTAWEILARGDRRPTEELVVKQTEDRLKALNIKALFQRQHDWKAYLIVPLLMIWLTLLWLELGAPVNDNLRPPIPHALAHKLREFSRELQEKAKSEGLRETMQVGRELEKIAQKGIDTAAGDETLNKELAGMTRKLEGMRRTAAESPSFSTTESQQSLKDLKAELEAARDLLNFPDGTGPQPSGENWLDRLAGLPQLKRELGRQDQTAQRPGQNELKSFLDRLEQQVSGELDRRTLLDAQQFLEQLMREGQGQKGESNMQVAGGRDQDLPDESEKSKSRGNLAGNEAGRKEPAWQPPPQFSGGAATHLKGSLGEGQSNAMALRGKPSPGKSEVSQEEVMASYRRQAEAELNTERVPEALKETIKNYFLSLGMGEEKK